MFYDKDEGCSEIVGTLRSSCFWGCDCGLHGV